jgi:beta-glucosidase
VEHLLSQMTLAEKISLLHGAPEDDAHDQGEAGFLPGIARLGIAPIRMADGPPGILTRYPATGLTATMGLAATFSAEDARANGVVIAHDSRTHGVEVALQPYINIHRDQTFARAYNTYGEDPLLTGVMGAALIRGIQGEGIMAMAKHFIGYDGATDVSVDSQALHEIYLAPFAAAIDARVAAIMCGYNVIDGAYACNNRALLTGVLRDELKFDGFVTSDWGAVHATPYVEAGDDLEMPGSGTVMASYFEAQLPPAGTKLKPLTGPLVNPIPEEEPAAPIVQPIVTIPMDRPIGITTALQKGAVSESTINRAAARILTQMQRFGLLDRHGADDIPTGVESRRAAMANAAIVLKTSEDAAVLLKNDAGALPLTASDLTSLALIGPGALQNIAAGEAGEKALGHIERQISPAAALHRVSVANIAQAVADDMSGSSVPCEFQRLDDRGTVIGQDAQLDFTQLRGNALPAGTNASWKGSLQIPENGRYRLYLQVLGASATLDVDGARVATTGPLQLHGNVLQPEQDNVLPSRDGLDNVRREFQFVAGPHSLMIRLKAEPTGQPVQIRLAWVSPEQRAADYRQAIDTAAHASKAVVFAWSRGRPAFQLPGDQDQLIADVAAVNPNTVVVLNISEPIAMPWLDKVKAVLLMWYPGDEGGPASANELLGRVSPAGRLPFTWPKLLQQNVANDPAHPERSSIGVEGRTHYSEGIFVGYRWFDQQQIEPQFPFGFGLSYTRFEYSDLNIQSSADGGLDASLSLRNAGGVASDEVVQLYLGAPEQIPPGVQFAARALAAFGRVNLAAGQTRRLTLHVAARALQYWSVQRRAWVTAAGMRKVYVGSSERDTKLTGVTRVDVPLSEP